MKKYLTAILLLFLLLVCFLNIRESSKGKGIQLPKEKIKENLDTLFSAEHEQGQQALFPDIYDLKNLTIDKTLPLLKFNNISDTVNTNKNNYTISIEVPYTISNADLFLFVNNIKTDMFYQISHGTYNFTSVKLKQGENLMEFFYRIGKRKSSSIFSVIIRE